mgnify:FL=1
MRIWKVSHGGDHFGHNELMQLRDSHEVCVARDTPAMGTCYISQGDDFFNSVKEGDFFYLCYGNSSIELVGRFKSGKRKKDGWVYREYECLLESCNKDKPYTKESHWWTPNFRSTFVEVKENDQKTFERLILSPYFGKKLKDLEEIAREKKVTLYEQPLKEVFAYSLNIPEYQRIYCWPESNVIQLLKDCCHLSSEYRLGSIILQRKGNKYDVIDGQQRLVTLSLILQALGDNSSPMLSQKFINSEAIQYIRYNKWLVEKFVKTNREKLDVESMFKYLTFNVLVLNNESRELAYTFFSNENSRGKALTDFDLLKAHHLRYVYEEPQARHLSKRWDRLLINGAQEANNEDRDYVRTLSMYIFRLRKWLNFEDWDENERLKVKKEYEAALIIPEIPPFGEKFNYSEPIQGGPHFFAYVEKFVGLYHSFVETPQYIALHHNLVGETHVWLRDVIEALLFAYYVKFGMLYLDDALVLIARIISQKRYDMPKIHHSSILEHARESKIAMFIDQATSPTFCLAKMLSAIETLQDYEKELDLKGKVAKRIRFRYQRCLRNMVEERLASKAIFTINEQIIHHA